METYDLAIVIEMKHLDAFRLQRKEDIIRLNLLSVRITYLCVYYAL